MVAGCVAERRRRTFRQLLPATTAAARHSAVPTTAPTVAAVDVVVQLLLPGVDTRDAGAMAMLPAGTAADRGAVTDKPSAAMMSVDTCDAGAAGSAVYHACASTTDMTAAGVTSRMAAMEAFSVASDAAAPADAAGTTVTFTAAIASGTHPGGTLLPLLHEAGAPAAYTTITPPTDT